jgi:hypothetical protein
MLTNLRDDFQDGCCEGRRSRQGSAPMPARRHQPHVTSLLLALLALLHLKTDACLCLRVSSSRTLDIYLGISACFRTYRTPALTEAVGFSAHARR